MVTRPLIPEVFTVNWLIGAPMVVPPAIATLVCAAENAPLLMETFGVPTRSCATTKYWIVLPTTGVAVRSV